MFLVSKLVVNRQKRMLSTPLFHFIVFHSGDLVEGSSNRTYNRFEPVVLTLLIFTYIPKTPLTGNGVFSLRYVLRNNADILKRKKAETYISAFFYFNLF